jgi:hypothetical protein
MMNFNIMKSTQIKYNKIKPMKESFNYKYIKFLMLIMNGNRNMDNYTNNIQRKISKIILYLLYKMM